ncbi:MAG: GNAT family N-acetyltransferase [Acidimicrobiia bacterium]
MHVRDGSDADEVALDALLGELHDDYAPGSFRPSRFRAATRTIVADEDGTIVGVLLGVFVDMGIDHESCGYIEELVVRNDHRGAGIGEQLVEEWKRWLRAEGFSVGFVSTEPEGPQGFYLRQGFRPCVGPWLVWASSSH